MGGAICRTGRTKSSRCACSLMGKFCPYSNSFSSTPTGLGSRMAAFKRPLASSELHGVTTLSPGMLPYQLV